MTNLLLDVSFYFLQVKVTQELKNTHTEQMTRLHFKHQTECDLLEDMRYGHAHLYHMHVLNSSPYPFAKELRNTLASCQMIFDLVIAAVCDVHAMRTKRRKQLMSEGGVAWERKKRRSIVIFQFFEKDKGSGK